MWRDGVGVGKIAVCVVQYVGCGFASQLECEVVKGVGREVSGVESLEYVRLFGQCG